MYECKEEANRFGNLCTYSCEPGLNGWCLVCLSMRCSIFTCGHIANGTFPHASCICLPALYYYYYSYGRLFWNENYRHVWDIPAENLIMCTMYMCSCAGKRERRLVPLCIIYGPKWNGNNLYIVYMYWYSMWLRSGIWMMGIKWTHPVPYCQFTHVQYPILLKVFR